MRERKKQHTVKQTKAGNRELYFLGAEKKSVLYLRKKNVGMQTCLLCLNGDHWVEPLNSGIDKIISRNEQSSLSIILLGLN